MLLLNLFITALVSFSSLESNHLFSKYKVNILVVEHATPAFPDHKETCLLGDLDVPLSEKGRLEAEMLREKLKKKGIVFNKIIASDLQRAHETAEILAEGSQIFVETSPALRETNKGDLQGLSPEQYRQKESYKTYKAIPTAKERFFAPLGSGPNVQTKADLARELIPLINQIKNDTSLLGKTVVIVTHGNPCKVFDILAKNPAFLDPSKNLEDQLANVSDYEDPKSCDVFLYHADANSFESLGKLP